MYHFVSSLYSLYMSLMTNLTRRKIVVIIDAKTQNRAEYTRIRKIAAMSSVGFPSSNITKNNC